MSEEKKYAPGKNPNSLANLTYHEGRKADYGKRKTRRGITITKEGWDGVKLLASQYGCSSVSDFIEKVGRGLLEVKKPA